MYNRARRLSRLLSITFILVAFAGPSPARIKGEPDLIGVARSSLLDRTDEGGKARRPERQLRLAFEDRQLAELDGSWRGAVDQDHVEPYPIEVEVRSDIVRVSYPSLSCSGLWHALPKDELFQPPQTYVFFETINVNAGRCIQQGIVQLKRQDRNAYEFLWYDLNQRRLFAWGIIRRS